MSRLTDLRDDPPASIAYALAAWELWTAGFAVAAAYKLIRHARARLGVDPHEPDGGQPAATPAEPIAPSPLEAVADVSA